MGFYLKPKLGPRSKSYSGWQWRPIWLYVQSFVKMDLEPGHYNDGFVVSDELATSIAREVRAHLKDESWAWLAAEVNRKLSAMSEGYPQLKSDDLMEFAIFCKASGGFEIW